MFGGSLLSVRPVRIELELFSEFGNLIYVIGVSNLGAVANDIDDRP
jgi:hypothetical protein